MAFATDPGWTPLFVSAAAIVLDIGGVLQHVALVARDLNKPCVAGIANMSAQLHDGQLVEVGGAHGIVPIIGAADHGVHRSRAYTSLISPTAGRSGHVQPGKCGARSRWRLWS